MDCPANAAAIERILPPGYALDGDPVVRIELQQWRRLAWLAGRGYNTLGVKVPVRFSGTIDNVRGHLLLVIWENMPDAIITGREELGYNKVYAELVDPQQTEGAWSGEARWFGHRFLEFSFRDLKEVGLSQGPTSAADGVLNFKYLPGTGPGAPADACYSTLTPPGGQLQISKVEVAEASLTLLPTSWQDMPTQHHIVEGLHRLALGRPMRAWRVESTGARDLFDTRRLR